MKRKGLLTIALCLIIALGLIVTLGFFTLSACNPDSGSGDKTWPSVSYLTVSEKYTGAGTITHTRVWDNDDVTVDINGATAASVSAYVSQLEAAGWVQVANSPVVGAGKTNYAFTKAGNTAQIEVIFFNSEQTSPGGSKYNLQIQADKDGGGVTPDPGGNEPAWYQAVNTHLHSAKFSVYHSTGMFIAGQTESLVKFADVERIGDTYLYKLYVSDNTTMTSFYKYTASGWQVWSWGPEGGGDTNVWRPGSSEDWPSQTKAQGFIQVVSYLYSNDYAYAKEITASGTKVIGNKTANKHDGSNDFTGQRFGSIYYLWNNIVLRSETHMGAEGYGVTYQIEGIESITGFSMTIPGGGVTPPPPGGLPESYIDSIPRNVSFTLTTNTTDNDEVPFTMTRRVEKIGANYYADETWSNNDMRGNYYTDENGVKREKQFLKKNSDGTFTVWYYDGSQWEEYTGFDKPTTDAEAFNWLGCANRYGANYEYARSAPDITTEGEYTIRTATGGYQRYWLKDGVLFITQLRWNTSDPWEDEHKITEWNTSITSFSETGLPGGAVIPPEPTQLTVPNVTISNSGLASWPAVPNASGYKYKIDNGAEQTTDGLSVQLTNGQSIQVKAVGNGSSYADSAWSAAQSFTQQPPASHTWPASDKLSEFGFGGLTKPSGATIAQVLEDVSEGQPYLGILISDGTAAMFNSFASSLWSAGATYGFNADYSGLEQKSAIADLMTDSTADLKLFWGFKPTGTANLYYAVTAEYYVKAFTDDITGETIAADSLVIFFTKIDLSEDGNPDPGGTHIYEETITLPQKFTIVYHTGTEGEVKTLVKDGDKLYWKVVGEYEDRERLAVKQSDGSYKIYDRDNKNGPGSWNTQDDYIPEYSNIYDALEGLEYNLVTYAQKQVMQVAPDETASGTTAGMSCNLYRYAEPPYTYSYYVYSGLVFKAEEQNSGGPALITFEVTSYKAAADLSGAAYQI